MPSILPAMELVAYFTIMQVARWCHEKGVELVVVGPEAPLVAGLCDDLRAAGIK